MTKKGDLEEQRRWWIERQSEIITNFFILVLKCLKRNNYYVEKEKRTKRKVMNVLEEKEISTKNRFIFGMLSILLKQVCFFFLFISGMSSKWIYHGKAEGAVSQWDMVSMNKPPHTHSTHKRINRKQMSMKNPWTMLHTYTRITRLIDTIWPNALKRIRLAKWPNWNNSTSLSRNWVLSNIPYNNYVNCCCCCCFFMGFLLFSTLFDRSK